MLYLTGGPSDVAYQNAKIDYESIRKVPAVWADNTKSGHGGTYNQEHGGANARMVLNWLEWQLRGKTELDALFLRSDLTGFDGWALKQKNFKSGK